jgi:hypothetical protein
MKYVVHVRKVTTYDFYLESVNGNDSLVKGALISRAHDLYEEYRLTGKLSAFQENESLQYEVEKDE